jgi:hypothetical protein
LHFEKQAFIRWNDEASLKSLSDIARSVVERRLKPCQRIVTEESALLSTSRRTPCDKVEDPKGNRVKVTMCGKFLP